MKKSSEKSKTLSYFIKLRSLGDFARNASTFGEGVRSVFALKEKSVYKIFAPSVKLGETRLMLYVESKEPGTCIAYKPGTATEKEVLELRDTMVNQDKNPNLQNIPIMEIAANPFGDKHGKIKVSSVRVKSSDALVKWIVSKSIENSGIGKVLSFKYKGDNYIGSFGLLDDEENKMFFYAKTNITKEFRFFRYNYTEDKVEPTDTFGEHSFLYVRIINLAEPFSFFKPE